MKKTTVAALVIAVMAMVVPAVLQADVKMGIAVNDQGLNSFYLALGDYNKVQQQSVVAVRRQGIPDEELPVVFYMASKANVAYSKIVSLRLKKWNWERIAMQYKLAPSIFNVPVKGQVKGRVYGKLYGQYAVNPQAGWNKINLADEDFINSVNLRLVSDYYGYSPEEVIRMREQGRNFIAINNDVKMIRTKNGWRPKVVFQGARAEAEGFYNALADYNMVRPWEIIRVRQQGISDEELPVLFFIAANAGVPYGDIVNLRLRNWTWLRIALRYGLDPSIFYVPVNERISGRIYGTTYGYYMMTPRESWNRIQLTDRDIMNLVNLRFVTDYYGFAPEEVIRMRERNRDFITINNDVHVMTTRNNWGQGNNNYRDKHNIGFKYDTKRQSGNMYNGQQPNVQGRDNQGFKGKDNVNKQGSNYQDLDDKGYKQAVNQQNNRNNNNNGQNTNNQGWNNNGGNKNSRNNQGMNNQGNVQNNNQGNIPQAQAPAAQATAVVQATEAPAQATVVPAGQEQGNNNNGSKDKGNNGKRNYGVGNGNGAGNAKHPVQ